FRAVKRIYRQINALKPQKMTFQQIQPLPANHVHSDNCGCGHRHLPSDKELQAGGDWRTRLTIVLAMGMRPCSGAIMVLLFSKVIGVYWWGILSAMAMALGTSLTISLLALFVHYARRLAVYLSRKRAPAAWGEIAWATLALTGGIILLFAGVLFYLSSQPEMVGAVRPFGR
ncbi:nickel/cobalt transporter, partial [Yersinia pseudotuberculosis]